MKHTRIIFSFIAGAALLAGPVPTAPAAEDLSKKEPKDIHDVMEWSHKGRESMAAKVRDGKGTPDEINTLLRFYKFMAAQKPPQGDDASWKEKTEALLKAAKADDGKALKKAANCANCHKEHKGG